MQARLLAQLGDRSEYSGERRRRSVVVALIVLTITDPLRGSYPLLCNLQAALIRSYGASFACMELTMISRFQRLQTSRKYSLHSLFYNFSVLSKYHVPTRQSMNRYCGFLWGAVVRRFGLFLGLRLWWTGFWLRLVGGCSSPCWRRRG